MVPVPEREFEFKDLSPKAQQTARDKEQIRSLNLITAHSWRHLIKLWTNGCDQFLKPNGQS